MGEACSTYGGKGWYIKCFGGEVREKEPLGRPRLRLDNDNKMGLQEVGFEDMDWIDLAQDRDRWRALVNAVMNLRFS